MCGNAIEHIGEPGLRITTEAMVAEVPKKDAGGYWRDEGDTPSKRRL